MSAQARKTPRKADRPAGAKPDRKDQVRPLELIGLSALFGVFTGFVVGFATREWILAAIFFGVVFIVSLVVLAMLMLGRTPEADRPAMDDDRPAGH